MAENIVVNGVTYNGVGSVAFTNTGGQQVSCQFGSTGAEWPDTPTAGNMPVVVAANNMGYAKQFNMSALTPAVSITIPKTGTYRIKYSYVVGCFPASLSIIPTGSIRLRKNGTTIATHSSSRSNYTPTAGSASRDMALNAGDVIDLYGASPYDVDTSTYQYSYAMAAGGGLMACIAPIDGYEEFIGT